VTITREAAPADCADASVAGPSDLPALQRAASSTFELALQTDVGTNRATNEDACVHLLDGPHDVVFIIADGIGGYEGGEVASAMAVEVTLNAYRESAPGIEPGKRLYRAAQRANIEIHDRALIVPELRRMGTTLTAVVVSNGILHVAHVGDCRLYLIRQGRTTQLTKDHTAVQERVRMGLMTAARARNHPERSMLTRCVGHELIVSIDRITLGLVQHDRLLACSDGLHGVLEDAEIERAIRGLSCAEACHRLVEMANARGTADNLTVAILTQTGPTAIVNSPQGILRRLTGFFRRQA
jgi:protein phosphatase